MLKERQTAQAAQKKAGSRGGPAALLLLLLGSPEVEDALPGVGVVNLNRAGEDVDVLVALASLATATLLNLDDEEGGIGTN